MILTRIYSFVSANKYVNIEDTKSFIEHCKHDNMVDEIKKNRLCKWRKMVFDKVKEDSDPFDFCSCFTGMQKFHQDIINNHKYVSMNLNTHKLENTINISFYKTRVTGCLRIMNDYFYINETDHMTYIVWWWKKGDDFKNLF